MTLESSRWVPPAMKVQLARLFGSSSSEAKLDIKSAARWSRILRKVLRELDRYLTANVETDAVHMLMLRSGLAAADQSLERYNFWPGYIEGIIRLALLLMGDYPDHRKRVGGGWRRQRYPLSHFRQVHFVQTPAQKLNTLLAAPLVGIRLKTSPGRALARFHMQFGPKSGPRKFFAWYRQHHPEDYAAVF
jgi:hypothetical protein